MGRGKSVLRGNCHMRSSGSLCFLATFDPVQHEHVCVPLGFWKVSIRMQCGPVQTPYGLWNNLRPVLQTSMGQIQGLKNQHVWAPIGRLSIIGSPSLKAVHANFSATGYTAPYGSKIHRKIVQTSSAVIRPV